MTEPSDLEFASRIAREVVLRLEAHGMKAAIGGAIAYGMWGTTRGTKDADINVFIGEARYAGLQRVLEEGGLGPVPDRRTWTPEERAAFVARCRDGAVAVAYHGDFRVDLFVPSIPFYDEAERTLKRIPHPSGQLVPVLSAEAVCVFKLLFFRPKDLVDLAGLVARQGSALDAAYVRRQLELMFPEGDERLDAWDRIVRVHGPRA
ncbi:MAG: hypothetical protein M9894_35410 [Planctomycetes bacterium]|nr:hypothetical protein [Planctomycetota bacterium]